MRQRKAGEAREYKTSLPLSAPGTHGQIWSNSLLFVTKDNSDVAEMTCNGLAHWTSSSWPHSSATHTASSTRNCRRTRSVHFPGRSVFNFRPLSEMLRQFTHLCFDGGDEDVPAVVP